MPLTENVMRGGHSAGGSRAIVGGARVTGATATGTTQATGYALTQDVTVFSTVGASSGATCPNVGAGSIVIYNGGANSLTVYPPVGGKINSGATNGGVTVATNTCLVIFYASNVQLIGNLSA